MSISDSEHTRLKEHLESQQWNKALEVTFELLESQPESSWLHMAMGNIYHKMNELLYAETSFKSAIYYQDSNVEAYTSLGFVYLAMGRIGTADDNLIYLQLEKFMQHSEKPTSALNCYVN